MTLPGTAECALTPHEPASTSAEIQTARSSSRYFSLLAFIGLPLGGHLGFDLLRALPFLLGHEQRLVMVTSINFCDFGVYRG
jgi:hypothetical protein